MSNLFNPNDSIQDNIVSLSKGNPGAATALTEVLKHNMDQATTVLRTLDEMNMYGPRIWLGYKDYCDKDANRFVTCVLEKEQGMIDLINARRSDSGPPVQA